MSENLQEKIEKPEEKKPEKPKLPNFDPDLLPSNQQNREAARARNLVYRKGCYRDEDGCPTLDKYGQPLG